MPAFNLSPAQRADLRAQAHALKPVVIIGAEGLTEPVLAEAKRALQSHQLIKIRVFGDDRDARVEMAETLCTRLDAALVQHIGKLLVIWRRADDTEDEDVAISPRSRKAGPSTNAATARRVAATPAGRRPAAPAKTPTRRAPIAGTSAAAKSPLRKSPARPATASSTSASPRERVTLRDEEVTRPRTGKGAAPRMVTVIKPTGNDRRRARPTEVLVRGNERVTAGGNVKRAKKRPTSVKRLRQAD